MADTESKTNSEGAPAGTTPIPKAAASKTTLPAKKKASAKTGATVKKPAAKALAKKAVATKPKKAAAVKKAAPSKNVAVPLVSKPGPKSAGKPGAPQNLSELIRGLPFDMPVSAVMAKAREAGMPFTDPHRVHKVRWLAKKSLGKNQAAKTAVPVKKAAVAPSPIAKKAAPAKKASAPVKAAVAASAPAKPAVTKPGAKKTVAEKIAAPKKATASAKRATNGNGGPVATPTSAVAAFRAAVLEIGLATATGLLAKYKADNAIV